MLDTEEREEQNHDGSKTERIAEHGKKPYCEDITYGKEEDYQRIMKEEVWLDTVAYSTGMYGRSGTLYRGHNTGKMYVITSRTSAIYLFP